MEQLRKKKAEEGRRKQEKESRQRKEKAERKQRRQEERRRRGPRTRGIKFTLDKFARLVNADTWDPSSPAHETLQRMVSASAGFNSGVTSSDTPKSSSLENPEIGLHLSGDRGRSGGSGESTTHSTTPRRPVGLSDLSDLAAAATASGAESVLGGRGDSTSMSVWGSSRASLSREASPGSSSQSASSKAAVNKAWADSVPVSLHQSIIGKQSSPRGASLSPTGAGSTVTSGVVDSSNPYAGAFASSLQQPFARATGTEVESTATLSRQSSSNWGSSAGEGDNLSDGGSVEASWGRTSADGVNPGATEFVPGIGGGDGAGGVASAANLSRSMIRVEEPSPTMSPQFSAMRPASDKAEFNVMAFPGSLMGNTMGGLGGGGSRSLLGMQGGDSLMPSNLQAPYQQWHADRSSPADFGYRQHHLQQQHKQAVLQEDQALALGSETQVEGLEAGGQQDQGSGQRQGGGQRNKGGKSKNRAKKSSRSRNQGAGNGKHRSGGGGNSGSGGGGSGSGRRTSSKKNARKNNGGGD